MAAVKDQIKRQVESPPGVFKPAAPRDHEGVIAMFAIAGRIVVKDAAKIDEVTATLASALEQLVPPERFSGQECAELWTMFVDALEKGENAKPDIVAAFHGDLERVARSLEVSPLEPWEDLPEGIDEPQAVTPKPVRAKGKGFALSTIQKKAKETARKRAKPPLKPGQVLNLLRELRPDVLEEVSEALIKAGHIRKSEQRLVERFAATEDEVGPKDQTLIGSLEIYAKVLLDKSFL